MANWECGLYNEIIGEKTGGRRTEMEMTFRWYGSDFDTVTLKQIRQIPG